MARSFLLVNLLKEAHDIDVNENRQQLMHLRRIPIINRDEDFVNFYRLSESLIESLEMDIYPHLVRYQSKSIPIRRKILCTLSFLATGSYQRLVGSNINTFLSKSSASRCIHEVVQALNNKDIVKKYIRFPQNALERQAAITKFYNKFKIPGVLGCIDGTLVSMVRPAENEERYYCRKGYHARNVQLITDADLNILHVDPSYGGASHDSFVFNNSEIQEHLQNLILNDEIVYLLGDSGYAQRPYMMTPVSNPFEGSPESLYNKLHATARNSVERTIGLLKGRFRCLLVHRVLHYHPDMVAKIVVACCVLHNLCNRAGIEAPTLSQVELQAENDFVSQAQAGQHSLSVADLDLAMGQRARSDLINNLWRSRPLSS